MAHDAAPGVNGLPNEYSRRTFRSMRSGITGHAPARRRRQSRVDPGRVELALQLRGLSASELARRADCPRQSLSAYRRAARPICCRGSRIQALAAALQVPIAWLSGCEAVPFVPGINPDDVPLGSLLAVAWLRERVLGRLQRAWGRIPGRTGYVKVSNKDTPRAMVHAYRTDERSKGEPCNNGTVGKDTLEHRRTATTWLQSFLWTQPEAGAPRREVEASIMAAIDLGPRSAAVGAPPMTDEEHNAATVRRVSELASSWALWLDGPAKFGPLPTEATVGPLVIAST